MLNFFTIKVKYGVPYLRFTLIISYFINYICQTI